ncbi:putative ribokinase [Cyphellophora attinorum]|uniref:Ribokinase n=1 Tax=Cyphellophora attinorum TaxID=1664694 RepID=A0A0N1HCG7_9EURO|nr:putative ribokinase [Phialophora attinorum]KPI42037.1 putative ribokinase [Phialophora attinorum]
MAQVKPLISVIGSLNVDFVTLTPRVPAAGETLTARSMTVHAGGKGANQAVACGKASWVTKDAQDVDVAMIGCVGKGDPYYASLLKPTLENSGVSMAGIEEIDGSQTGTATILVEDSGQNRILFVPGANFDGMQDSRKAIDLATKTAEPTVLVMQGEIPRRPTFEILEYFGSRSTQTIWNPAPVYDDGIPARVLQHIDYLIVNETECLLLAKGASMAITVEDEDNMTSTELESIAKAYKKIGVKNLLVTLGARGVFYSAADGQQGLVAGLRVPKVVDTTAAGDTFVGFFAAALARYGSRNATSAGAVFDVAVAVKRANAGAAVTVQRPGAGESIPFGYEVS